MHTQMLSYVCAELYVRTSATVRSPASTDPQYLAALFRPAPATVLARPLLRTLPVPVAAAVSSGGGAPPLSCQGPPVSALAAALAAQGLGGGYTVELSCSPAAGTSGDSSSASGHRRRRRSLQQQDAAASCGASSEASAVVSLDLALSFGDVSSATPAQALGDAQAAMESWAAQDGGGATLCPTQPGASSFALVGYVQVRATLLRLGS